MNNANISAETPSLSTRIENSFIQISQLNKGQSNQIIEDLENNDTKFIMKNNKPAAVLLSINRYQSFIDMFDEYLLELQTAYRLETTDRSKAKTGEELLKDLGIDPTDPEYSSDVELEIDND